MTKSNLRKLINEEISKVIKEDHVERMYMPGFGQSQRKVKDVGESRGYTDADGDDEIASAVEDIADAIQMLESEVDVSGTLFHVINRLHEALHRLESMKNK